MIFGYPGETEADRAITFRTMSEIARQFRNVSFSPNIFTPYPGIPIWPQLRELGVHEPKSLREWMEMPLARTFFRGCMAGNSGACRECSSTSCSTARFTIRGAKASRCCAVEFAALWKHRYVGDYVAALCLSLGAVVSAFNGTACVAAVSGYRAGASKGAGKRMLKRLSLGGERGRTFC